MKHTKLIELSESNQDGLVVGAKNIRLELKANFPGVKFGVRTERFSMGDSIDVKWTDGPTSIQVDSIIQKYSAGSFDGMVDLYTYSHTDFTKKHGDAKYVMGQRSFSDFFVGRAIAALKKEYNATEVPTVEDYNNGKADGTPIGNTQGDQHWEWQSLITRWCSGHASGHAHATKESKASFVAFSTNAQAALKKMGLC